MSGKSGQNKKDKNHGVIAIYDENGKTFEQLMEEAFKLMISKGG